jgi:hypothetical protein
MIVQHSITRRSFLKSASALLALPYLETFGDGTNSKIKKKMIFFGQGYGFVNKTFYPTEPGKFSKIGLSEGLYNLKENQNNVTLLENLINDGANDPHSGSLTLLTGAAYSNPNSIKNSVSVDQVAADYLCKDTRYSSLILSTKDIHGGHGRKALSLSWDKNGKPLSGLTDSMKTYYALFSNNEDPKKIKARIDAKRSILDDLKLNIKSFTKNIAHSDKDKLDEYFQSIRQIELKLKKEIEWSSVPKPKAPFDAPEDELDGETEIKLMFDLMILALQTEQTRVATYMMPSGILLKSLDINIGSHSLSHYTASSERTKFAKTRDAKYMELFNGFITKMKNTRDRQGQSLYDSSTICYGSNLRSKHTMKGMPMLLSGGGIKKLRLGESLFLPKDTALQNVWLTLLQENGIPVKNFSSSTGSLPELLS